MYIFRVLWETHNPKVGKKDGRVLKGVETARKCDCWYASLFPVPFQDLSTLQYVYWSPSSRRERSSGTTSLLTSLLAWSRGDQQEQQQVLQTKSFLPLSTYSTWNRALVFALKLGPLLGPFQTLTRSDSYVALSTWPVSSACYQSAWQDLAWQDLANSP